MAHLPPELSKLQATEIQDTSTSASWSLDLDIWQTDQVAQYMTAYASEPGQPLLLEGDRGTFMGLILSGRVDIVKEDSSGAHKVIATLGPGKMIGEMGLIDGGRRSASVITREMTTFLVLTNDAFDRLSDERPRLALQLMKSMAKIGSQRLRQTSGQLTDLLPDDRLTPVPVAARTHRRGYKS